MIDARRPSTGVLLFAWSGAALFVLSLVYFLYSYLIRFGERAGDQHSLPVSIHVAVDGFTGNTEASPALSAAVDIALFSIFALHHSIAARTSTKMRLQRIVPAVLERSVYTWIASILFILVCALWQFVPGGLYHLAGIAAIPGYVLQSAGVVLTIRSSARLDVLDLAGVRPILRAEHGSPQAHVPLDTGGPYRFVRHPVYFGWVLIVFGAPQMTMTRFVFAVVSSTYLAIAIPFEERSLIHTFGADYRAYKKAVRWRMIPGLY